MFCPCVYAHEAWGAACWRHGDDFVLLATRDIQQKFHSESSKAMVLKCEGVLGPCPKLGDVSEIRCLNRLLSYAQPAYKTADAGCITYEADPRHLDILQKVLGIPAKSKSLSQPMVKPDKKEDETKLNIKDA